MLRIEVLCSLCCVLKHIYNRRLHTKKTHNLYTKPARLQQTCSKLVELLEQACCKIYSHGFFPAVDKLLQACSRLATSLMDSINTAFLQVVPTTCYQAASQLHVNKLLVTNLVQLGKITPLLQLVHRLVANTSC